MGLPGLDHRSLVLNLRSKDGTSDLKSVRVTEENLSGKSVNGV